MVERILENLAHTVFPRDAQYCHLYLVIDIDVYISGGSTET